MAGEGSHLGMSFAGFMRRFGSEVLVVAEGKLPLEGEMDSEVST